VPLASLNLKMEPSRQNLMRLCLIRGIVIFASLCVLSIVGSVSDMEMPWLPLYVILAGMAAFNVIVLLRLRSEWSVSEGEFFANLLLDVAFHTTILYFVGGSTNPIVSYYLVPLIISAAVLRPVHTWFIAFLTMVLYTVLFFTHRPLPLFAMRGHEGMTDPHSFGMWVNFGFTAALISWFVVGMAATLREQSRSIARSREEGLRNEQIISVASIAAGTAHEMRTPLATMAVTVDEIGHDHPELEADVTVLKHQIERCDAVLRELVSKTTEESRMVVTSVANLMDGLLERWSLIRPETKLEEDIPGDVEALEIRYDQSLEHALMSFLNNAADASPDFVSLAISAGSNWVRFRIEDRGPGIPQDIANSLGKTYITRKRGGLGLGVLLSQASIERLGGEVLLNEATAGGTRLDVLFPRYRQAEE
jgi:two-component system sensor histidine kinase RegB